MGSREYAHSHESPTSEPLLLWVIVEIVVTRKVGHFWKADPDHFSKAPKIVG